MSVRFDSKANWWVVELVRHYKTDLPRLYGMVFDTPSWPTVETVRMLTKRDNELIQFGFADRSRVAIDFVAKPFGIVQLVVTHEGLASEADARNREQFWLNHLAHQAARLLASDVVAYSAPGKINLFFKVGRLKRDGYHEVASVYQAVDLRETVIAELDLRWRVEVTGNIGHDHVAAVPTGEDNLVVKAARAAATAAGKTAPAPTAFAIEKRVPVAGGMGGGSADAAAAISAVNELWTLGLNQAKLRNAAAEIGADVPFTQLGGTAIGRGKGEKLEPLENLPTLHWVLLPDALGLSTPTVFARLDELREARGEKIRQLETPEVSAKLIQALKSGDPHKIAPLLENDLQEAALSLRPDLIPLFAQAEAAGALRAIISGSGPTIALLAPNAEEAQAIASRMRVYVANAIATSGPAAGVTREA